jgi:sulfofructosephosphate aldolase
MLFDRIFGRPAFDLAGRVAPSCARIMAADALGQVAGRPVEETDIDAAVSPEAERDAGAAALKLLLIWRPGETRVRNLDIARRFMEMSRRAGMTGIVEAVVRPAGDATREGLIVDAARALAAVKPDLYKCEVPFQGNESDAAIGEVCAKISAASPCPWVVLSQGVPADRFANAVAVACRNGASGFLAGRAVWADTIREPDYAAAIRTTSVPRLRELIAIVDANVRRPRAGANGGPARAP